jgi:hypothetical protein
MMLSDRDRGILEFEETYWVHTGRKQNDIREQFGVSAARYYQLLHEIAATPDAVKEFPQLTKRMLERRNAHERAAARRAEFNRK